MKTFRLSILVFVIIAVAIAASQTGPFPPGPVPPGTFPQGPFLPGSGSGPGQFPPGPGSGPGPFLPGSGPGPFPPGPGSGPGPFPPGPGPRPFPPGPGSGPGSGSGSGTFPPGTGLRPGPFPPGSEPTTTTMTTTTPTPTTTTTTPTTTTTTPTTTTSKAQPDQCGKPATFAQSRILGGSGVVDHSQPWVARLGGLGQCTGTLISNRHILTAAHCDKYVKPPVATLGDYDAEKNETGEVTIKIKTKTDHPLYWLEGDTAGYDFSIWTLEEKVQFSKTIQPVCLPSSANETYAGSEVINSGWGLSNWNVGDREPSVDKGNRVLNTINLTTFPMTKCKNSKWLSDRLSKTTGRDLDDTMMICAGVSPNRVTDTWIGANKGDSGGPLTVKDSETGVSTIIGVATDAPYTREEYLTGPYCTYSRVSAVLPWIHETMKTT